MTNLIIANPSFIANNEDMDHTVVRLEHPARSTIRDWEQLLDGVVTVNKFIDRIKKHGMKHCSTVMATANNTKLQAEVIDKLQKDAYNKYIGDAFEVFTEALIKSMGNDRRIGIHNYKPLNANNGDEDYGVDGYGIGTNGRPATVQVKLRTEINYVLTANADHLTNFKNNSHEVYGVEFSDTENMLIVTTAKELHHTTRDKMLNGKVRCLNRSNLELLVDDNIPFWDNFRQWTQKSMVDRLLVA